MPKMATVLQPAVISLKVTRYERISAAMLSAVVGLLLACGIIVLIFVSTRQPRRLPVVPLELLELPGGVEDGSIEETLRVDSPEPERFDASPAEEVANETEIAEALETVVEMSDEAAEQVEQQFEVGLVNRGKPGSANGTGKRALGSGPGQGGYPREQRWFMRFAENASVEEYARQLSFFGIQLGAWLPDGRLAYLEAIDTPSPQAKYVARSEGESRLHMSWQGGGRRSADEQLFRKAKVDVDRETPIFHFYSPAAEAKLVEMERAYRGRPIKHIRRTYFAITKAGAGYEFVVTKQIAFQ